MLTRLRRLTGPLRLLDHPLNRRQRLRALRRWFSWKVGSCLVPGPVIFRFVNDSMLIAEPGMNAATCNLYTGLYEFEEMAFVLHFLRTDDLFLDVGANIGAYTILASAVCGAASIAIEPVPRTFAHLERNLALNGVRGKVDARNVGLAAKAGTLRFTTALDSVNHVATGDLLSTAERTVEVEVSTLDHIAALRVPQLLKIDVEGYESEVIAGGAGTIANRGLRAVIIELNGSGRRYGYDEDRLREYLSSAGFEAVVYRPFRRLLESAAASNRTHDNTLYVRDPAFVADRLKNGAAFHVNGQDI